MRYLCAAITSHEASFCLNLKTFFSKKGDEGQRSSDFNVWALVWRNKEKFAQLDILLTNQYEVNALSLTCFTNLTFSLENMWIFRTIFSTTFDLKTVTRFFSANSAFSGALQDVFPGSFWFVQR